MPNPEIPCPECSGAGFFGDNGPVAESLCGFCRGTGVLINGGPYLHAEPLQTKPITRAALPRVPKPGYWEERIWRYGE
jgi:hypothetical protein